MNNYAVNAIWIILLFHSVFFQCILAYELLLFIHYFNMDFVFPGWKEKKESLTFYIFFKILYSWLRSILLFLFNACLLPFL